MNHSIVEALGIAAAVVLMALVIIFGFRAYQSGQDTGNNALSKMETVNSAIDESQYTQYDGAIVSGSAVYQAVRSNAADSGVAIDVIAKKGGSAVTYNPQATDGSGKTSDTEEQRAAKLKNANTKGNDAYITPSAKFLGSIHRNENGNIDKVTFTIQR